LPVIITGILSSACTDTSRRQAVESSAQATAPELGEADLDSWAALICRVYEQWPSAAFGDHLSDAADRQMASLSERQQALLAEAGLPARASERCPEAIPPSSVPDSGRLPRPSGQLALFPGLFAPEKASIDSETNARLEWTAVGLGCISLRDGEDRDLRVEEARFFESMGYTRDSYIAAMLEVDDGDMSDRIFARIQWCARQSPAAAAEP
jgi:hypothetical protein